MQTDDTATVTIASPGLQATIARRGGELVRLRDEAGRDLLWDGDPAFWTGHAPLLFPIVGRLKDDRLMVEGQSYPMRQHGFARTSIFDLVAHGPDTCHMRLQASEETRRSFPFAFSFDVTYRLGPHALEITVTVCNRGDAAMPVAMGFHPAFRWPLPYGAERLAHEVVFATEELGPIGPLLGGLLSGATKPSPVQGRVLKLDDTLFADDALVFLNPKSRSLRYGPAQGRSLRVDFPLMPQLGIWSKPGAGFVCLEPWAGYASPQGFDGELASKPGSLVLAPGQDHVFGMGVTLDPA